MQWILSIMKNRTFALMHSLIITNSVFFNYIQYTEEAWKVWHSFTNPLPAFRPKNRLFLRNRGRWFRISTSFSPQTSSFGHICILPPSEICTRSTRTSWSCTPWSQFFYSNFFLKFLTFLFIMFMRVLRVYLGYLLLRVYVGYLLLRVYVRYLLVFTFEGVCRVFTLRVYAGIYVEGVLIDAFLE